MAAGMASVSSMLMTRAMEMEGSGGTLTMRLWSKRRSRRRRTTTRTHRRRKGVLPCARSSQRWRRSCRACEERMRASHCSRRRTTTRWTHTIWSFMTTSRSATTCSGSSIICDLGSIDAKYDVAVWCPPHARSSTTTSWKPRRTLRRAVDYLRTKGVGVATFLILEKQRHLASEMAVAFKADAAARGDDVGGWRGRFS